MIDAVDKEKVVEDFNNLFAWEKREVITRLEKSMRRGAYNSLQSVIDSHKPGEVLKCMDIDDIERYVNSFYYGEN